MKITTRATKESIRGVILKDSIKTEWTRDCVNENGNPELIVGQTYKYGKLIELSPEYMDDTATNILWLDAIFDSGYVLRIGGMRLETVVEK